MLPLEVLDENNGRKCHQFLVLVALAPVFTFCVFEIFAVAYETEAQYDIRSYLSPVRGDWCISSEIRSSDGVQSASVGSFSFSHFCSLFVGERSLKRAHIKLSYRLNHLNEMQKPTHSPTRYCAVSSSHCDSIFCKRGRDDIQRGWWHFF